MADRAHHNLGLLILAGIGAGTILGASVGLLLGRRAGHASEAAMSETVEDLQAKAQQVLSELSKSIAQMRGQSAADEPPIITL